MERERITSLLQWVGWGIIMVLCVVVGLLWTRMDRQVAQNRSDIVDLTRT